MCVCVCVCVCVCGVCVRVRVRVLLVCGTLLAVESAVPGDSKVRVAAICT